MSQLVCNGAALVCSFGVAPGSLTVLPAGRTSVSGQPAATVMNHVPTANISGFGMCTTLSNPAVASATAAAQGVLTPQPCLPVTTAPWTPGCPTVTIAGSNALTSRSQCVCQWGGVITVTSPGQVGTQLP